MADADTGLVRRNSGTARGIGLTMAGQAARVVIQLGSIMVLARILAPGDFGLVAMVTALVMLAEIVRDFGLFSAAIQAPSLSDQQRSNLFWLNTVIGLACALAFVAMAPLIAIFYGDDRLTAVVLALTPIFVINGMATQYRASLNRAMLYKQLLVSDVASQALGAVAAILGAIFGLAYWSLVLQQLVAAIVVLAVTACSQRWVPGWPRRAVPMRNLVRFGLDLLGSRIVSFLPQNVDNIAIGALIGPVSLGLYSRAFQLVSMPINYVTSPLMRVALPVLSRSSGDNPKYARQLQAFQSLVCYLNGVIFALFAGLAGPLAILMFGGQWLSVGPLLAILAIGSMFRSLTAVWDWVFLSLGFTRAQLKFSAIAAPLWAASVVVAATAGVMAVAITTSAGAFLFWVAYLRRASLLLTDLGVGDLFRHALLRLALVPVPVGLIAHACSSVEASNLMRVLLGTLGAAVYLIAAARFVPVVRSDISSVRRLRRTPTLESEAS